MSFETKTICVMKIDKITNDDNYSLLKSTSQL
jgi:hypothetical protein